MILKNLLFPNLKKNSLTDDQISKINLVHIIVTILIPIGSAFCIFYYLLNFPVLSLILVSSIFIAILSLRILRKTSSPTLAINIIIFLHLLFISSQQYYFGIDIGLSWILLISILAICTTGVANGVVWVVFSVLIQVVLYFTSSPEVIDSEYHTIIKFLMLFGAVIETCLISIIFIKSQLQNNNKLVQEKEQLSVTLTSICDAVIATDKEGNIALINKNAEYLTGWKGEDARGKPLTEVFQIINEKTRKKVENPVDKVLKDGKIIELANHTCLISKNKTEIPIEDSGAPIKDRDGNIVGVVLVFRDVTEKRRTENEIIKKTDELKKESVKYSTIIKTSLEGFWAMDLQGRILEANDCYCNMVGYTRQELLSMFISEIEASMSQEEVGEKIELVIKHGYGRFETKHRCKDGTVIDVDVSTNFLDVDGGQFVVFIRDITQRKQFEKELESKVQERTAELQKSSDRFNTIIKTTLDGFSILDLEGNIIEVNECWCTMMGYTKEEMLSLNLSEIEVSENPDETAKHFEKIIKQGYDIFETKHKCKDGIILDTEISVHYLDENKGQLFVFIKDISERKQFEKQLERKIEERTIELKNAQDKILESEAFFKDISYSMSDWIWELDKNGKYIYVSGKVKETLGYEPGELMGKTPFDFMPEDEAGKIGELFKNIFEEKKPVIDLENWCLTKDGNRICFSTSGVPIFNDTGEFEGYRGIDRDITDKKQAEKEIKDKAEIIENVNDGISSASLDMKIKDVNNACLEIFGYKSKEEIIGKPIVEFFIEKERKKLLKNAREDIEKGQANVNTYTAFNKITEKEVIIQVSVNMKKDDEGKPVEFIAVMRDVTELKNAEIQIKEAREAQARSEKLAMIGKLSSSIAHELRNPLGSISNSYYFIEQTVKEIPELKNDETLQKFISIIKEEVDRSNTIITDLLDFSKQKNIKTQPTNIKSIIETILDKHDIPENIIIEKYFSELDDIHADSDQLVFVFRNIIQNAIQAMKDGGTLILKIIDTAFGREITISDTGCGIPENVIKKIYEPLVSTKTKGTGLGLAIVKNILDAHEAKIEVQSIVDDGTTFTILFPDGN